MPPFLGKSDEETIMKINRGEYNFDDSIWSKVSGNAKDLISLLLTYDMDERPSAAAALNHPWLTQLSQTRVENNLAITALENMLNFRADLTLKRATYAFIASQLLTKPERDALSKVFKALDRGGDGKLSPEEIKEGFLEHYHREISDEDVAALFENIDTDRNGQIDYSEFVVAAMSQSQLTTSDKL